MSPSTSRRALLAGCTVGVCGIGGCLADDRAVEEPITETRPAGDLAAVAAETAIGDVTVRAAARDTIAVEGRKAAVSRDDLEAVGLRISADDGVLEVAVDRDDSRTVFGFRPAPLVDLSLAVPVSLPVRRLESTAGRIDVAETRGDLTATTAAGDVTLRRIDGTVSATTGAGALRVVDPVSIDRLATDSGDVTASLSRIDGDAIVETGSGDVELALPTGLDATLAISTETGGISVSGVDDLPEMAGDSLIEAVVGDGRHRLEVRTESGDVTVTGRESVH